MGLRLGEESFRQSQWVRCGRTDVETDEASELLVRSWRVYTAYTTSGIYKSAFVHGRWAIVLPSTYSRQMIVVASGRVLRLD